MGERNSSPDRHKIPLMRQITTPLGQAQPNQVRPVRERHGGENRSVLLGSPQKGLLLFREDSQILGPALAGTACLKSKGCHPVIKSETPSLCDVEMKPLI